MVAHRDPHLRPDPLLAAVVAALPGAVALIDRGGEVVASTASFPLDRVAAALAVVDRVLACGAGTRSARWAGTPVVVDDAVVAVVVTVAPATIATTDAPLFEQAEELQRALLPAVLPTIDALDVAVRYVPARGRIGGDWYDVVRVNDGRVALVVGDVVGYGVRAATAMGMLRHALLVFAGETADPGRLLERLNRFVARRTVDGGTVLLAVVDIDAGEITCASAGHVPMVVRAPDGTVSRAGAQLGLPLGVDATAEFRTETVPFPPGAALVLVTDGVVERRGETIDRGLERLDVAVATAADDVEALADAILEATLPVSGEPHDDAAILVARRPLSDAFAFTAPAGAEQLALLRQLLERWLVARAVAPAARAELLLAAGEAAANVVEHAYGPATSGELRVQARVERDEVVVVVADDGRWRQRRPAGGGRGLELLRAVVDRLDIDPGPDGTTVTLHRFLPERTG